jgi:tetratricopeptide (TPR) repeat protein
MRSRRTLRALAALLAAASLHVHAAWPALARPQPAPPAAPARPADANWYKEALALQGKGMALVQRGEVDAGIAKLERSRDIAEKNRSDEYIALGRRMLAVAYVEKRDPVKVEALYQRIVDVRKKMEGPKGLFYAMALNDLGNFYYQTGRFDRARPELGQCFANLGAGDGVQGGWALALAAAALLVRRPRRGIAKGRGRP